MERFARLLAATVDNADRIDGVEFTRPAGLPRRDGRRAAGEDKKAKARMS